MQDKLQGEIEGVQDDLVNVQGDLVGVQDDITNVKGDFVDMQDKLQEEIKGVQGDITNVQGDITNVQGDIVDMQNANSALCAYQDKVGGGNNGASCSLDKSTGKFTAGKSGVYQVSVSARSGYTKDHNVFGVYLRTSSGKYQVISAN